MQEIVNLYQPKKPGRNWLALAVCVLFLLAAGIFLLWKAQKISDEISSIKPVMVQYQPREIEEPEEEEIVPEKKFVPGNFTMNSLKTRGCVADGILNGYGGKRKKMRELIDRSECVYLHRALETWLETPDFSKISQQMAQFEKSGLVFGMFLAEAVRRDKEYDSPKSGKEVDIGDMCKKALRIAGATSPAYRTSAPENTGNI